MIIRIQDCYMHLRIKFFLLRVKVVCNYFFPQVLFFLKKKIIRERAVGGGSREKPNDQLLMLKIVCDQIKLILNILDRDSFHLLTSLFICFLFF